MPERIVTLKNISKASTDEEIKLLVDFLEQKIDSLPHELLSFEEPLIEAKPPSEERDPEGQGSNEKKVFDLDETIEDEKRKRPHLYPIRQTAIVHSESPPSPTDTQAINFLKGKPITGVIAPEMWINPERNEAAHNVRALEVEEPNVASIKRLGTKSIPITDVFNESG